MTGRLGQDIYSFRDKKLALTGTSLPLSARVGGWTIESEFCSLVRDLLDVALAKLVVREQVGFVVLRLGRVARLQVCWHH